MKYDSMRKLERNQELQQYAKDNRGMSWKEIGQAFNVSGSRAWKICGGVK